MATSTATATTAVAVADTSVAVPGQDLGSVSKYVPGSGTHIHNSHLYASVLGFIHIDYPRKPAGPQKRPTKITPVAPAPLPTISVTQSPSDGGLVPGLGGSSKTQTKGDPQGEVGAQTQRKGKAEVLPEVNSIVLCKVTRITPRQATVAILVVGETVLDGEWQGLIRVQDVRATEKDRVKIFESFRPGDVVRALVISLGDQSNYYLSTASNNLGVIMATSEAGNAMYPVSWKEYRDPETGSSENRKVAKPL